jgi:hypothetical protein
MFGKFISFKFRKQLPRRLIRVTQGFEAAAVAVWVMDVLVRLVVPRWAYVERACNRAWGEAGALTGMTASPGLQAQNANGKYWYCMYVERSWSVCWA